MMPGESGFDFAVDLRSRSQVPILTLTARGDPQDRVRGLEIGVDDYLAKPFEPRELLLRIASVLRRARAAPVGKPEADVVRFGPYAFSLERGELRCGEEIVRITDREREILRLLAPSGFERLARGAIGARGSGAGADGRRAHQSTAAQNRTKSRQSRLPADCARNRLSTGRGRMIFRLSFGTLRVFARARSLWRRGARGLAEVLPKDSTSVRCSSSYSRWCCCKPPSRLCSCSITGNW